MSLLRHTPLVALLLLAHCGETPRAASAEFYSVKERNGGWWLIAPGGERFYSLGVNAAAPGPGQEEYLTAPPQYSAWRHYNDLDDWTAETIARLRDWQFNTIGGWHDKRLRQQGLPHVEVLHLGAELGAPWIDMFDESFAASADRFAAKRVAPDKDDAQLIGWFIDNELGWYADSLFKHFLGELADNHTRQALVAMLKESYSNDFAKLQADFVPSDGVEDFASLERDGSLSLRPQGHGGPIVAKFVELLADQYYRVTCAAIRKHDPNHLILGDRYPGYCPDAVAIAAGRHVDVVSTNYDWPAGTDGFLPRSYLNRLHRLTGKPIIVTEYYAAAAENQSGNPNSRGLFLVTPDQQTRAAATERRLAAFAELPFVVGAHWFAYADEPPTGRPADGEDYNFGLVDIHNQPYRLLTEGMRRWHPDTLRRHARSAITSSTDLSAGRAPVSVPPLDAAATLDSIGSCLHSQQFLAPATGNAASDLLVGWQPDGIYLTLAGNAFVEIDAYATRPTPSEQGQVWNVAVSHEDDAAKASIAMLSDAHEASIDCADYRYWSRGVRRQATIRIAPEQMKLTKFAPGMTFNIRSELQDRRENSSVAWEEVIKLSDAAANHSSAAVSSGSAP